MPPRRKRPRPRSFSVLLQEGELRRYCDSVPVHLLSIFKEDFQDPAYMGHPERKRWKPWLDAQLKWVEIGRAHPLLVCNPQDMLVPWIGDVAAAPILADMVMAVVERGKDPKVAAKEASDKISRDIIGRPRARERARGASVAVSSTVADAPAARSSCPSAPTRS